MALQKNHSQVRTIAPFIILLFYIQPENDGFGHVTPLSDNSYENVTKARKIFFNYQF